MISALLRYICLHYQSNKTVSIKWAEPEEVNGAITHYHLKFNAVTKREHLPICIASQEFQSAFGYAFRVSQLAYLSVKIGS